MLQQLDEETRNHDKLGEERKDLVAQLRKVEKGDENPELLELVCEGIRRWTRGKRHGGATLEALCNHLASLNMQYMDKVRYLSLPRD